MSKSAVGIVGAGVIGASLAHALHARGIDVVLHDVEPAALERAAKRIAWARRLTRLTAGGDRPGSVGRLEFVSSLDGVSGCDLVVENVTEDPRIKVEVHGRLDAVLAADAVVAVNTSAVPISELALSTGHPERVIGSHFMNPVATSTTVEVIRTPFVAPWALDRLTDFVAELGKESVVVEDAAGFVINRCLMIFINEAAALLDDAVATPQQVDRLFRGCLGHQTGPLRTADIIGIDTVVRTLHVLADHHGPQRFTPSPRLLRMVSEGHVGRKSGQGFYAYSDGKSHDYDL